MFPLLEALTRAVELDTALLAESPRKAAYRLEYALTSQALGTLVLEPVKEHAVPDSFFSHADPMAAVY